MDQAERRSVGRPRAQEQVASGPAREAILHAAAELFAQQGFAGTTTRQIADRVGIRQPSLFYHFKKKDDILLGIIDEAAAVWLDYLPRLKRRKGRAAVKLYELMHFDFCYLMTEPFGIGQLILLPQMRMGATGDAAQRMREKVVSAYRSLIRQGIKEGDFLSGDISVITYTIFGMGEALWSWYKPTMTKSPEKIAQQIADLAMRALLRRPASLGAIKKTAQLARLGTSNSG